MGVAELKQVVDPRRVFCVMLHDVAPRFQREMDVFVETLSPLVGSSMSAGIVPCWAGDVMTSADRPFAERVRHCFQNLVLHGFTHIRDRGRGFVSRIASGLDEMNGLTPEETDDRLRRGQQVLQEWFGRSACGFIAPTFQIGLATPDRLARHGIQYTVGYRYVIDSRGQRLRLATWCWDVSPIRALNYAGHWVGEMNYRLRKSAIPCLALHPLDFGRGFLPRIVQTVKTLLDAGRSPIVLEAHGLATQGEVGTH